MLARRGCGKTLLLHHSARKLADDIQPIYEPEFASANQVKLSDDDVVLGVVIDGEAKAYPIRVLNYTEMVNDELAGIPILATW